MTVDVNDIHNRVYNHPKLKVYVKSVNIVFIYVKSLNV